VLSEPQAPIKNPSTTISFVVSVFTSDHHNFPRVAQRVLYYSAKSKRKEVKIMKHVDVIPEWKNEKCRRKLSEAPDHLADLIKLRDQLAIRSGALAIPAVAQRFAASGDAGQSGPPG
jgi:hypothetical protein